MSEKLHRTARHLRAGSALLVLWLACGGFGEGVQAAEPQVRQVELYIGESVKIESGFSARVLNLDPELVKLSTRGAGTLTAEGRQYGTATVWIWDPAGTTVLRIRVLGHRAADPLAGLPAMTTGQPFSVIQSFRYFGYRTSGRRSSEEDVAAHDLELRTSHGSLRARGRLWTETREGEVDIPQYDLLIERENGSPIGHALLHLGTVEADWSQFTFYRERLRGGRLELRSAPGGRQRANMILELCYGDDIRDYAILGSRSLIDAGSDSRLGGGRFLWRPLPGLTTTAEMGAQRDEDGETRTVTALGAGGRVASLLYDGLWASDGEHWATQGSVRWTAHRTTVSLGGKRVQGLFRTLHGGRGLPGTRYVNVGIDHSFDSRLRLSAASSWRRWERMLPDTSLAGAIPDPLSEEENNWRDNRHHSFRGTYRLSSALRASGWWRLDDNGTWDIHWVRRRAGFELAATGQGFGAELGPRWGVKLGTEKVNERASNILQGDYVRYGVYVQPEITFSNCLGANFRLERRLADETAPDEPSRFVWRSQAHACVPPFSFFRGGMVTAGYRKWEYLSSNDGLFISGRHFSTRLELETNAWSHFSLKTLATWERDIDLDVTNTSLQVSLSHQLGASAPASRGGAVPKGTVRGCVFHDLNSNGRRERNEPGLPGMTVRLEDGRETVTNGKGCYRFRGVWGRQALVRIIAEPVQAELTPTTPLVQNVEIVKSGQVQADFGLGPAPPMLEILAYNDLNENTRRDEGEPLVPDVLLYLTELDVLLRTAAGGVTRQQLPTDRPFVGEWTHRSLPTGYSPLNGWKTVTPPPEAGLLIRWELPLRALRSVRGRVFLDGNRNGTRDRTERTVEGVVLQAGDRFTVSDAEGEFLLKVLPPGAIEITVTGEGVPRGWSLPEPRRVTLEVGPTTVDRFDVPLQPGD